MAVIGKAVEDSISDVRIIWLSLLEKVQEEASIEKVEIVNILFDGGYGLLNFVKVVYYRLLCFQGLTFSHLVLPGFDEEAMKNEEVVIVLRRSFIA